MLTALTNATVFTGSETLTGKAVLINGSRIEALADINSIPADAKVIDMGGEFLAPGLIDLQIAGSGGYLFSASPSEKAIKAITESIVHSGTTHFLIAVPTDSPDVYGKVINTVRTYPDRSVLGLHLEGPYISQARRGAHLRSYIRPARLDEVRNFVSGFKGAVRMVTVAPEVCSHDIVKFLNDQSIVVAAGHSNATFKEGSLGFGWGIRTTTHLFNAMSQLHHRDPGLPGAAFESEVAFASIIADGIHVDYHMISIAKKIMKERLFLISDAVEQNLSGTYLHVRKEDRFTLPDGTLSGSKLTMLEAVKNCVTNAGISLDEALRMASTYPAIVMNLADLGRISPGCSASLVGFTGDFRVRLVMVDGDIKLLR